MPSFVFSTSLLNVTVTCSSNFTNRNHVIFFISQACLMSIPVIGQVYTTYHCAASLARLGVEIVESKQISPPLSVPLKVVTGGLLGTAGAVVGCTVSLIHMPAGPFLWLHQLKTRMALGDYTQLADHFSRIAFRLMFYITNLV